MRAILLLALCLPGAAAAMANPASVFCAQMGGTSLTVELPETSMFGAGEVALCELPSGALIEEWTLFRMLDGRVPEADPFAPEGG